MGKPVSEREFRKRHVMEEKLRREREIEDNMARLEINRQIEIAIRQVLEERAAIEKQGMAMSVKKLPSNVRRSVPSSAATASTSASSSAAAASADPNDVVKQYPSSMRKTVLLYTADRRKRLEKQQQKKKQEKQEMKQAVYSEKAGTSLKSIQSTVDSLELTQSPRSHRRQPAVRHSPLAGDAATGRPLSAKSPAGMKPMGRPDSAVDRPSRMVFYKNKPVMTPESTPHTEKDESEMNALFGQDHSEGAIGSDVEYSEDEDAYVQPHSAHDSRDITFNGYDREEYVEEETQVPQQQDYEDDFQQEGSQGSVVEHEGVDQASPILSALKNSSPTTSKKKISFQIDNTRKPVATVSAKSLGEEPLSPNSKRVRFGSEQNMHGTTTASGNYIVQPPASQPVKSILRNSSSLSDKELTKSSSGQMQMVKEQLAGVAE